MSELIRDQSFPAPADLCLRLKGDGKRCHVPVPLGAWAPNKGGIYYCGEGDCPHQVIAARKSEEAARAYDAKIEDELKRRGWL